MKSIFFSTLSKILVSIFPTKYLHYLDIVKLMFFKQWEQYFCNFLLVISCLLTLLLHNETMKKIISTDIEFLCRYSKITKVWIAANLDMKESNFYVSLLLLLASFSLWLRISWACLATGLKLVVTCFSSCFTLRT